METGNIADLRYLISHIVENLSLPDFIESETESDIEWIRPCMYGKCCCPLHKEDIPSFHLSLKEDVWIYHCFGCGSAGNIIHFCKNYHGLRNKLESINYLCKKYNIENTSDLILEGIKKVNVKIDDERLIENANILVSNQCRILLRKNFELHRQWVLNSYKKINSALRNGDQSIIDKIGYEASKRMHMK